MNSSSPFAHLSWSADGQPFSEQFDDVYFSSVSALEEARHVFLQHNNLPERWATLADGDHFCIGETGFGTGRSFLAAWQLWDQCAPKSAFLHFVSSEQYPLSTADLRRAHTLWPELQPWSEALISHYSDLAPGWQHFVLAQGRVTLTLLIGDMLETLPQLDGQVDAWFLDGFAPGKNPDMWQPALYQHMARLSRPGTTVATFTSVGEVRRGLIAAGFDTQKVPGHGYKRHMLAGVLQQQPALPWAAPWYLRPTGRPAPRTAIVIGAGLAGCCTAFALARRGWQVTVLERHKAAAQEASGNPQGILYCKLSPHHTPLSRFVQSSYAYSLRLLQEVLPQGEDQWQACGVLQLAANAKEAARLARLGLDGYPRQFLHSLDAREASTMAGVTIDHPGLFFPEGGWVNPPALCEKLLQHPAITLKTHSAALHLQTHAEQWQALDGEDRILAEAQIAVICSAADSQRFAQTAHLPLKAIRGQITHLPATERSAQLRTVLCAEGYISPARQGVHHLGASFRFDRTDFHPSTEENQSNLALLDNLSPTLADALQRDHLDPATLEARAALRCTTPDYLPVIGPVVNAASFQRAYAALGKDASKQPSTSSPWLPGLFINAAHGSRGLISCPLSGELIAAQVTGEPLPLPIDLAHSVHPSRFLLRQLVRGQGAR
ncbi:bifunctional tRNA (5-methylaminomethyl-2-thiouridine)(34)-methyltransferase MnmD/FAD-dependent 5-carboxymethylaminomethyl-2-thiouridine(34) oxidoreductase MnmC [Halopseudomonas pelagia]|uniref:bifunctional tRNA (5-methylaminomethyl-2-thiouridine)(34)-methyltransferase MnmD/FAD-dependent 5-carboxymethylaminomethyl-2-thiouridine(34) oxidoreductase MnmC n=1 Tax=Halopseudomonas pelagia TaxID=553151 RepID=UPI0030D8E238